jgi:prevent-host-death family protein
MPREYSLYEAKAQLSALVKQVREGRTIVITVHGKPAAELRPIAPPSDDQTIESRIAELEAQGVITPAQQSPREFTKILEAAKSKRRPGALMRFLEDRG